MHNAYTQINIYVEKRVHVMEYESRPGLDLDAREQQENNQLTQYELLIWMLAQSCSSLEDE